MADAADIERFMVFRGYMIEVIELDHTYLYDGNDVLFSLITAPLH